MSDLPASPDLSHLKKQARQLLREARAGEGPALARFAAALPAWRVQAVAAPEALRLHDAQSTIAREHGCRSWTELKRAVEWKRAGRAERLKAWLGWAYDGNARERGLAARLRREEPGLFAGDGLLACTTGDEAGVAAAIERDPAWANRPGGPLAMPPLVAVTHSRLMLEPGFEAGLLACAARLLANGADVNAARTDPRWPDSPLSALYGAAGVSHHPGLTRLLLEAGANPDDNESLYHSVESGQEDCTRLLLEAGARVTGTNALGRVLDYDRLDRLQLLLAHGGDAAERPWIHHAILRGRSLAHIEALLAAGADPRAANEEGVSLYRWARLHGRADVVALLEARGISEALTAEERFVAACTQADEGQARALLAEAPDMFARLTPRQRQVMPELAGIGAFEAVRTMLRLGWPREVKAGWDATALNLAAFRGDAAMVALLLDEGADWRTPHGYGDTVIGTLSFASQADAIEGPAPKDYAGCARALLAHGVPKPDRERYGFAAAVAAVFEAG